MIVDELTQRDAALLEELRNRTEPTAEQRSALERVLAAGTEERSQSNMPMSDETVRLLREDILASGRDDWVSLAEICGFISRRALAETVSEKCELILRTVRLLLEEELVEIGDLPAPTDPGFLAWPGSTDEVMSKFAERVFDRSDDPASWEYSTWLNLTSIGDRASADIVRDRSRKR